MMRSRLLQQGKTFLKLFVERTNYRESYQAASLVGTALLIGVLAGLGAVAFDRIVHYMGLWFGLLGGRFGGVWGAVVGVLVPALGGLLITPIVVNWSPDVRGSGIPNVMLSVSNFGGRLPKRIVFWRPIASAISIGTGASLGSEGPVVQLSAALASLTSGFLKLNDEGRRNLIAVAAAGGISATFNAPIAGMLFALEVILGKFGSRYVASVVIGSVAASVVSRAFLGPEPAFVVPDYGLNSPYELPLYFVMSILAAFVSIAIIRTMTGVEDIFNRLKPPRWFRPTLGGLLIGVLGLALPQVLGRGYEVTGDILTGRLTGVGLLLLLTYGKMLAMSLSLASWQSGGIFAPILMTGAAFGAAFGELAARAFPDLAITPGAFALVGMAAVFSGAERAPMSTIVLIFEMSGDYRLILPLLLATVVAMLISELFQHESIYHVMLSRKGQSLLRLRDTDLLQTVTVREVMDSDVPTLKAGDTLQTLTDALVTSHHHGFVLTTKDDPEHIAGIVTLSDLEKARSTGIAADATLREVGHKTVYCALPDEPISAVLERMAQHDIGRMPVVDPKDARKPIGFVRQSHLARAYYQAVQRERTLEEAEDAQRLRDLTGQEIVEVRVRAASPLAGKTLRDIALPKESIVVAIRRRGTTVFPHGDTVLEPGDVVVANVAPGFSSTFRGFFTAPSTS